MTTYTDTDLPNFKVGLKCYSIAECAKHVSNNYEFLKDELEKKLGLVPQWKKDMQANGTFVQMATYSSASEPDPWELTRIQTMPSGYQTLTLKRGAVSMQVQNNSFTEAYCTDVQKFIDQRMQRTRDKLLKTAELQKQSDESERRAKREIELAKAKKVLARDQIMPDFQRNALHKDSLYMAELRNASAILNEASQSATKAKAKVKANQQDAIKKRMKAESAKRSAKANLGLAQAKLKHAQGNLRRAKAKNDTPAIPDLQAELAQMEEAHRAAESAFNKFLC